MIWICIFLVIALAASLSYIYTKKREARKLNLALLGIVKTETNAKLTTATGCKHTAAFVKSVNTLLQENREIVLSTNRQEANLKRAITNISHDLRTPLTAARGYLQMLETQDLDEETRKKYLQIIQERLATQTQLMDSFFEFAQVLEGREVPTLEDVNLCNIMRDVLSANCAQFAEKGFDVQAEIPDAPVFARTSKDAAVRILQNLVRNACVHGKDYLRISIEPGVIEIANKVQNIKDLDISQMFDRFYTADAARTNKTTGLGLAIVKELAAQMGWEVTARVKDETLVMEVKYCLT